MWGFWDSAVARDYDRAVRAALQEASGRFCVLADISDYPPQTPEVQAIHGGLMAEAKSRGVCRAANLVSSVLSQNQIRRLSEASGLPTFAFFSDSDAAQKWLLEGIKEQQAAS